MSLAPRELGVPQRCCDLIRGGGWGGRSLRRFLEKIVNDFLPSLGEDRWVRRRGVVERSGEDESSYKAALADLLTV